MVLTWCWQQHLMCDVQWTSHHLSYTLMSQQNCRHCDRLCISANPADWGAYLSNSTNCFSSSQQICTINCSKAKCRGPKWRQLTSRSPSTKIPAVERSVWVPVDLTGSRWHPGAPGHQSWLPFASILHHTQLSPPFWAKPTSPHFRFSCLFRVNNTYSCLRNF